LLMYVNNDKDQKWTRVTTSGVRCFYWDVILSFIKFFGFSLSFISGHFVLQYVFIFGPCRYWHTWAMQ
jgi:hypothetical protein